ncbi:MAG: hypothetical protein ACRETF_02895, partial [Nevskiaceae bacterium]
VADSRRKGWPIYVGISGRLTSEYATGIVNGRDLPSDWHCALQRFLHHSRGHTLDHRFCCLLGRGAYDLTACVLGCLRIPTLIGH